jgi:hypothetical protein
MVFVADNPLPIRVCLIIAAVVPSVCHPHAMKRLSRPFHRVPVGERPVASDAHPLTEHDCVLIGTQERDSPILGVRPIHTIFDIH